MRHSGNRLKLRVVQGVSLIMLLGRYHYSPVEESEAQRGLSNLSQITQLDMWKRQDSNTGRYIPESSTEKAQVTHHHFQTLLLLQGLFSSGMVITRNQNRGQSFAPFKF